MFTPNRNCSFSDHEAIAAEIKLTQNPVTKPNKSEFRKNLKSEENRNEIDKAVKDAIEIMDKSLESAEQWRQEKPAREAVLAHRIDFSSNGGAPIFCQCSGSICYLFFPLRMAETIFEQPSGECFHS